jgi:hypothetical protein
MDDVRIAITTAPSGISLASETRLLKPALLYADHVTLYSPTAALLVSTRSVGEMGEEGMIEILRQVGPLIDPNAVTGLDLYRELQRKKRKNREEMQALLQMRRLLRDSAGEWLEKVDELLEQAGAAEILPALEAGLVSIDPLVREGDSGDDALFRAYLDRLRELLGSGHAYPLLDDQTGDLVRASVNEGVWELGAVPRRRGKQATAASQLMERLPAFPEASIAEVLDIRERLRPPLVRFRAAMVEMERLIEVGAHESDFAAEVEDLYIEKVAPALQEMEEAIADDKYLRQLVGAGVADAKTYASGGLALGVALFAQVPHLTAVASGVGASAVTAAAQAAWKSRAGKRETERHQLFFLYKLGDLLQRNQAA